MQKIQLQNFFKENFYDSKGKVKGKSISWAKKNYKEFFDELFKIEPRLNQENLKLKHIELFLFENYSYDDLKCPFCSNLREFNNRKQNPLALTCKEHKDRAKELQYKIVSEKLKNLDKKEFQRRAQKAKETFKEKYGVDNPMKVEEIKEKAKKTFIEKYGVDNPLKSQEIREKIKIIWQEKYKTDNPMKAQEVQEKAQKTCLERYGVENPFKSKEIQEKCKNTWLELYGVEHPLKSKEIYNKSLISRIEKYKYKSINQNPYKKYEKIILEYFDDFKKLLNKYQNPYLIPETEIKNFVKEKIKEKLDTITISNVKKLLNYKTNDGARKLLIKLNLEYKLEKALLQQEISEFIKSIYQDKIIENDREVIAPLELDIYIPEKNLAIEFNGLFWHSIGLENISKQQTDLKFQKIRHLEKTEKAEAKNINLLHIFENEWLDPIKQDIWKSIISYKLGIVKQRYFARKLFIKEINSAEAEEFLKLNHIQGSIKSTYNIGLFENDKLISLMTFGKSRFNKNYQYELYRFASLKYTSCVGCAAKLFNYFIKNYDPQSIISYANRRWASSLSNVYQKLGFKFLRKTNPNYYYFKLQGEDKFILHSRNQFQKYKLKKFENYDENKSELEIMLENGYRRIYDAGQLVYEWRA